ncbi:MAG: hypothetical protein B7Y61_18920 [Rhizobiales bacterium 35-66-30]|nr:MAG: hypothetical protein B7Y61_18920 [Rhizobiales bacterium 35-66-30]OZA96365.1 MAG: hypothetical protein B7X67_24265 [Rhizobiales bacterium 39-66-18]
MPVSFTTSHTMASVCAPADAAVAIRMPMTPKPAKSRLMDSSANRTVRPRLRARKVPACPRILSQVRPTASNPSVHRAISSMRTSQVVGVPGRTEASGVANASPAAPKTSAVSSATPNISAHTRRRSSHPAAAPTNRLSAVGRASANNCEPTSAKASSTSRWP